MTKLQDEYGKKGLVVMSLTSESLPTVLKFLSQAQMAVSEVKYRIGAKAGFSFKRIPDGNTIPYSFLIGVDGAVIWQGNPGSFPEKLLKAELEKVKLTDAQKAEKAQKPLQYAETLISMKRYLSAERILDRVTADYKGTDAAKKAEERKAALEKDEAAKKELAAQKALDKTVGGLDFPKDKFKKKEREAAAVQLESFIKQHKEDAPGAVDLASVWVKVMQEDWKRED